MRNNGFQTLDKRQWSTELSEEGRKTVWTPQSYWLTTRRQFLNHSPGKGNPYKASHSHAVEETEIGVLGVRGKSSRICRVGYQGGGSYREGALEIWEREWADLWALICASLRGNYQSWGNTYHKELAWSFSEAQTGRGCPCPHKVEGRNFLVHGMSGGCFRRMSPL